MNGNACKFDVGLVNGRPAPKKSRQLILGVLELDDDGENIMVATESRFNHLASCRRGDVVLLQDGEGFRAGQIQLHFDIADMPLSLVQTFTLHRRDRDTALAVWRVNDGVHECFETKHILAAVEYCVYPNGHVGTLLPIEYT